MNLFYVIKEPLITEKVANVKGETNRYAFRVDPGATKIDIRRAIETIFKVGVENVRTISVRGKSKLNPRNRRTIRAHNWKKAIITLKKGAKIELFEGA